MTKKIKLTEAARDLKVESQELIDLMEKYDGTKRKNATALSGEEMNYILEHYSQNNQVENFNAYFESKNKPIVTAEEKPAEEIKKPAAKKEKTKTEKSVKKSEPKKAAAKPKDEIKPAEIKKETAAPKLEKQAEEKPASEKKADRFKRPENPVQTKKQPKQQPKAQKHGEKQKIGTAMSMTVETTTESNRRTVDTRGSYVNLDKYNERYEQIAPANKHKDNYSKKQKINQKSAQRNKNRFSNKRETEAEKLRRLELERARKQQLKVLGPE
ncbi:MAG: translation initiation factor IF-2, partial [Oscillospiraceae bacterium]|nr:translation initiation factor IF-2 [Oscillospiraceae bacterium]